jgi:arsenate reductase (thioredoxin)
MGQSFAQGSVDQQTCPTLWPPSPTVHTAVIREAYLWTGLTRGYMNLSSAEARLRDEFAGIFCPETVSERLQESYEQLSSNARIDSFIVLLAERFARERLRAAGQVGGSILKDVPEVLFVCVHNAGRSQMAAALLDQYAGGRVHVRSAGSTPASEINPAVIAAMDELGIDLSKEFPKPLTTDVVVAADVVVTMGCGDACPVFPGKRYLDWELEDPAGKDVAEVRRIRDEINERVRGLLAELEVAARTRAGALSLRSSEQPSSCQPSLARGSR